MSVCPPLILGAFVFLFAGPPAQAEIYRWTDGEGSVHFTSDASKIPARYRSQSTAGVPKRTINVTKKRQPAASPKPATSGEGDPWNAMRPRVAPPLAPSFLEHLKKGTGAVMPTPSRELVVPETVPPLVLRPELKDPEPQNYHYACPDGRDLYDRWRSRPLNRRCRRSRTGAWDAWNARQKQGTNP